MNDSLTENNYIYIPNFISEASAKVMASNFKHHCKENDLLGDEQAPNSHSEYNFIDFLELLCEKSSTVSQIIGETVLPTYSYARVYKDGSILERHRDRDACEISLTVHLEGDKDWPIYIETPSGEEVELVLKPGDAMIYLGCVADHWRNQFLGTEYIQVFLHYVRSRGDKKYAYFDKKINEPKKEEKKVKDSPKTNNIKKNIEDYIVVLDNIIPNDLCDRIINEYKDSDEWDLAQVANNITDTKYRNVHSLFLSTPESLLKNEKVRKKIDEELFNVANEAIKKYSDMFNYCNIVKDSGYDLLRYDVGQFYIQHTDSYQLHPRTVSCSFALNDDYEGGEFAFFDRELKYNLKKGSILLFPSSFMYPHEIMTVTKGTRYSIVTWFI